MQRWEAAMALEWLPLATKRSTEQSSTQRLHVWRTPKEQKFGRQGAHGNSIIRMRT